MKNALFAINGYKFKSEELLKYFSSNAWYIPDPRVENSKSILSKREREWLELILVELEKRNSN